MYVSVEINGCVGVVLYYNPNLVWLATAIPTSSSTHLYTCLCPFLLIIVYTTFCTTRMLVSLYVGMGRESKMAAPMDVLYSNHSIRQ